MSIVDLAVGLCILEKEKEPLSPLAPQLVDKWLFPKRMVILTECSPIINRYIKEIHRLKMEKVTCPCCDRRLRKHGSYKRNVVFKRRVYTIPVARLRCPSCDVTFSFLPYFLSPWKRFA